MRRPIETNRVRKNYCDQCVLQDVSLSVMKGDIYGLLGPNGAGKSTIINLLAGFISPSGGSVDLFGHSHQEAFPSVLKKMGIVPDQFSVHEGRTGGDHIRLVRDLKSTNDSPRAILERVGLKSAISQPAGEYSRGMKQRLALAMALVGDPELLLLDEPFSGLDPEGVRMIRDEIYRENSAGTTILFSSHILDQADLVCDRVGILHEGEVIAEGPFDELRRSASVESTYRISMDGPLTDAKRILRDVDGVEYTTVRKDSLLIHTSKELAEQVIVDRLNNNGIQMLELHRESLSVEALYVSFLDRNRQGGKNTNET